MEQQSTIKSQISNSLPILEHKHAKSPYVALLFAGIISLIVSSLMLNELTSDTNKTNEGQLKIHKNIYTVNAVSVGIFSFFLFLFGVLLYIKKDDNTKINSMLIISIVFILISLIVITAYTLGIENSTKTEVEKNNLYIKIASILMSCGVGTIIFGLLKLKE